MKKLTFKDLSKKAQAAVTEVFDSNEKFDTVHVTTDGQCFINPDNARNHEADLRFAQASDADKEKVSGIAEVSREDVPAKKADKGKDGGAKKDDKVSDTIDHVVTQEDLDMNPDLASQGVAVGDTIQIPNPDKDK